MAQSTFTTWKPLAERPELSPTLPSWIYRDRELFEREKSAIFGRCWSFAVHASQVSEPGCRAPAWVDDRAVVVVRDEGGRLRAFGNACGRHGHELVVEDGRADDLACPFHGWRYGLDGALLEVPGHNVEGAAGDLRELRVETLAGLVFVNPDPAARPLAEQAPDLESSLRGFLPDIEDLVKVHETHHDIACNWKVLVENSLECYHCEPCHPGFAEAVDMERYRSFSEGIVTTHSSERRRDLAKFGKVSAENADANRFRYWYVWPATEIDCSPPPQTRLSVFTRRSLSPERFRLSGHYFRLPGDEPGEAEKRALAEDRTLAEDIAICEAVQRGLGSMGYRQGRFIVDEEHSHISEHSVHHFQTLVAAALDLRPGRAGD